MSSKTKKATDAANTPDPKADISGNQASPDGASKESSNETGNSDETENGPGPDASASSLPNPVEEGQSAAAKEINSLDPLSPYRDTQEGSNQLPVDNEETKMAADKLAEQKNQEGDYTKLGDKDDRNLDVLKDAGAVEKESLRGVGNKDEALSKAAEQESSSGDQQDQQDQSLPFEAWYKLKDASAEGKDGASDDQPQKNEPSPVTGPNVSKSAEPKFSPSGKKAPNELTVGQKLARTHIKGENPDVTELRDTASILIDRIDALRNKYTSGDVGRWASAAITQIEAGLGLAEKAATA